MEKRKKKGRYQIKVKQTKRGKNIDRKRKAMHPGPRISASGKKYSERRSNRSDMDRRKRFP